MTSGPVLGGAAGGRSGATGAAASSNGDMAATLACARLASSHSEQQPVQASGVADVGLARETELLHQRLDRRRLDRIDRGGGEPLAAHGDVHRLGPARADMEDGPVLA